MASTAIEVKGYSEREWQILKFMYSEKATNFCEISTVDLSYVVMVKSTVETLQNFVSFSEYMNFKCKLRHTCTWWDFISIRVWLPFVTDT